MLKDRSNDTCELCSSKTNLSQYTIPPSLNESVDTCVLICDTCKSQINSDVPMDPNHWRCLNDSMWSEHVAVQIMAWRMLQRLRAEGWPKDLLDMMYLDEDGTAVTAFPTVAASDTITLNGGTTGGIVGDYLELIDIATNQYHVRGVMRVAAGANPATPFTAAVS